LLFVVVPCPLVVVLTPAWLTILSGIRGKMDSVARESRHGSSSLITLWVGKQGVVFLGLKFIQKQDWLQHFKTTIHILCFRLMLTAFFISQIKKK
jgi:hypothetical protein